MAASNPQLPDHEFTEEIPFESILSMLADESNTFPARELIRFSGLEGQELQDFTQTWSGISGQLKTGILEDLELLSEGDTVFDFDQIAAVGLNESDEKIRQLAIRNLWQTEDPALLPKLVEVFQEDESPAVRAQAAQVLGRFLYLGEVGRIKKEAKQLSENALFGAMDSEQIDEVRQRTLEALAYSSDGRLDGLIEDAYDFGEEDWQAAALFAMGRSADNRWVPTILERLEDPNADLVREAARAAGGLEIEEAIPSLLNLLYDEIREVRLAAAWSLSQIGGDAAAESLDEYLERAEDDDEVDLIEDAIDNLAFNLELDELNLLDYSKEELEQLTKPEELEDDENISPNPPEA